MSDSILRKAYGNQRRRAAERGVEWRFTFEEWLQVWVDSGKLHLRGRGKGRYVMSRPGDVGPYSTSNVVIQLCEVNARDARLNHPNQPRGRSSAGRGRGWTFAKGAYQVMVGSRYVGRFATAELAEAAYRVACSEHVRTVSGFLPNGYGRDVTGIRGRSA